MSITGKVVIGVAIIATIVSVCSAFQFPLGNNHTVENGVHYENGQEMHVIKPSYMMVRCTVGEGSVNSTFNITAEAMKHLGFPKPLYTSDAL